MTEDPVALAAESAINQLVALLTEARSYLEQGNNLAAIGTLIMFDDQSEDLRAAIRLLRMAHRGRP
jgi:stage V sporulation protein SpoVS